MKDGLRIQRSGVQIPPGALPVFSFIIKGRRIMQNNAMNTNWLSCP